MIQQNLIRVFYPPYTDCYVLTPYGRDYSEDTELITREDRASSGKMRRDIIASKKTFTLSYEVLDDTDLQTFINLSEINDVLKLEVTKGEGKVEVYDVLMSPFSQNRILAIRGGLWGGVSVSFVEV